MYQNAYISDPSLKLLIALFHHIYKLYFLFHSLCQLIFWRV